MNNRLGGFLSFITPKESEDDARHKGQCDYSNHQLFHGSTNRLSSESRA